MPTLKELRAIASAPNNLLGRLPTDLLRMVKNRVDEDELRRALLSVPDQGLRAIIWESMMELEAIIERSDANSYHAPDVSPWAKEFDTAYNLMSMSVRNLLKLYVDGHAGAVNKANCQAIINKYKHIRLSRPALGNKLMNVNSDLSECIKKIESMP